MEFISKSSSILTCLFTQEVCCNQHYISVDGTVAVCGKCGIFCENSCWFVDYIVYALCKKETFLLFVAVEGENDCDIAKVPQCKWPALVLNCTLDETGDCADCSLYARRLEMCRDLEGVNQRGPACLRGRP